MERLCEKCGSLVSGDVKFCPNCGEPLKGAVDLGKTEDMPPVQSGYGDQTNYVAQQSYGYSAPQYGQNIAPGSNLQNKTMTAGQWVGTIILCTWFGLISFILNIVWAFGANTPEPKRSFCRAVFILEIIGMALSTILAVIMLILFRDNLNEFLLKIEDFNFDWSFN